MINLEVESRGSESNNNLIRRFSRKFNNSGIYRRARGLKSRTRIRSKNVQKEQALKRLKREGEIEELIKLGKLPDRRVKRMTIEEIDDEE